MIGVKSIFILARSAKIDPHIRLWKNGLLGSDATLTIHPGMAKTCRARIGALIAGLSDAERMEEAKEALRALIETVELVPVPAEEAENGRPGLTIHLHGALASLLLLATGLPVHAVASGPVKGGTSLQSVGADLQATDNIGELVLVAGANNRRNLPELKCAI